MAEDFTKNSKRKSNKEMENIAETVTPKKGEKVKTVRFAIRIPEDINDRLEQTAKRLGMTKKGVMMLGLKSALDELDK